jgi:hypothetical protein
MLANDLAEAIPDFGTAVVPIGRLWWEFLCLARRLRPLDRGTDLLYRTDADAVGFSQSAVDGASLGNAQVFAKRSHYVACIHGLTKLRQTNLSRLNSRQPFGTDGL